MVQVKIKKVNQKINQIKTNEEVNKPIIEFKKLSFQDKKEMWKENAIIHDEPIKCDVCKKAKKHITIFFNDKEICYRCWIKKAKKNKKSNKTKNIHKEIKAKKLDSKIYIVETQWGDIR